MRKRKSWAAAASLAAAIGLAACGKAIGLSAGTDPQPSTTDEDPAPACASPLRWSFVQPEPSVNRSVDLLFVVDTSSSLAPERGRIAATIPAFLGRIQEVSDLRIAVMAAHGGASSLSGRLMAASGSQVVLNTQTQSMATIQAQLQKTLEYSPADRDEANGELLTYSLMKSFTASRLAEIQGQGFYRPSAALSIVLVTDENDGCYLPAAHGFSAFPDYVASVGGWEETAARRYCSGVTPEAALARARAVKGGSKLTWAGITHVDPSRVPAPVNGGEDAIGHGLIELVRSEPDGVLFDVEESSYEQGLAALGNIVSSHLDLRTSFALDGATRLDPSSVRTRVDGRAVSSRFTETDRVVSLRATDAGRAGSTVEVTACPAI